MNIAEIILVLSLMAQAVAAIAGFLMPRDRKLSRGWFLLAGAMSLICLDRVALLMQVAFDGQQLTVLTELLKLAASLLMTIGVVFMRRKFLQKATAHCPFCILGKSKTLTKASITGSRPSQPGIASL